MTIFNTEVLPESGSEQNKTSETVRHRELSDQEILSSQSISSKRARQIVDKYFAKFPRVGKAFLPSS